MSSCSVLGSSRMNAKKLRNPFLLTLASESLKVDNYEHGISLKIVCEASFWVFSFWCVEIASFHDKLSKMDWTTLRNSLIDSKFINDALYANDLDLYKDQYETVTHKVAPPSEEIVSEIRNHALSSNRSRYPLVVLLVLNDNEIEHTIEGDDIVLLVAVIHLKDKIIPLETSVIASYIKRKCGTVLNLHDLFLSTEIDENNKPACVICLTNSVTVALLPCRHTCLCDECFPKITQCPLCRSPIQNCIALDKAESPSDKKYDQKHESTPEREVSRNRETESFFKKCKRILFG